MRSSIFHRRRAKRQSAVNIALYRYHRPSISSIPHQSANVLERCFCAKARTRPCGHGSTANYKWY